MIDAAINILLLSLIFSVTSSAALYIRGRLLNNRGSLMCVVWAAALLFGILPVYSEHLSVRLYLDGFIDGEQTEEMAENTEVLSEGGNAYGGDYREIGLALSLYGENGNAQNNAYSLQQNQVLRTGIYIKALYIAAYIFTLVWTAVTAALLFKAYIGYRRVLSVFKKNSVVCGDARLSEVFNKCLARLRIKRKIELRVINDSFTCSPCVAGVFNPIIYIDSGCRGYGPERLELIMMHELCHIKRKHLFFKLLVLFATSVHWFNPISRLALKAANEDCEFACDSAVLKYLGHEKSDSYMYTILEIADRVCRSDRIETQNGGKLSKGLENGLFMSANSGKNYLERRYVNMKTVKIKRGSASAALILIVASFILNAVVVSSCGVPLFSRGASAAGFDGNGTGNFLLDEALRSYYNLSDGERITKEQIEGVTSIEIRPSTINYYLGVHAFSGGAEKKPDVIYVDYIINGSEVRAFPDVVSAKRFYGVYLQAINDYYIKNEEPGAVELESLSNNLNPYVKTCAALKVCAFYTEKDPGDLALTDRAANEMKLLYPESARYPIMVFDPFSSEREIALIANYYLNSGLLEGYKTIGGYFDASALKVFCNLKEIIYWGIKPLSEKLPAGAYSEYRDYIYSVPNSNSDAEANINSYASASAAPEGGASRIRYTKKDTLTVRFGGELHTASIYNVSGQTFGPVTDEDGTMVYNFYNKSLQAAIEEYFIMRLGRDTGLTARHLEQITSIRARLVPEYDKYYDKTFALHGGHYIEYTINGVTLGLLPMYLSSETMGRGLICDIMLDGELYGLSQREGIKYYALYQTDKETQLEYFASLAKKTADRVLLTGIKDSGGTEGEDGFYTDFAGRSTWSGGIRARYIDSTAFDGEDIKYFTNLTDFQISF